MNLFDSIHNEDNILFVLKQLTEEYKKLKKNNMENLSKIDNLNNIAKLNKTESDMTIATLKAELNSVKAELNFVKTELVRVTNISDLQIKLSNCKAENRILLANADYKAKITLCVAETKSNVLHEVIEKIDKANNIASLFEVQKSDLEDNLEQLTRDNNFLRDENNFLCNENNTLQHENNMLKEKDINKRRRRKKAK
jgi:hypothetical protein